MSRGSTRKRQAAPGNPVQAGRVPGPQASLVTSTAANVPVRPGLLDMGCEALAAVLTLTSPADVVLRRFFREHAQLGRRDRGFIAETVFAALRRMRFYAHLAQSQDARLLFVAAAHYLPVPERRELGAALRPAEVDWIACADIADSASLPLGIRAELPDWVIELMRTAMNDEEVLAIGRAMQSSAPLDLRVNTVNSTRDDVLKALHGLGLTATATPYSPVGVRVQGKPALEQTELYLSGKVEVQDEGSQLLGFLLAPRRREMVVDFCAGAGGKTLLLGALMRSEGRLYAFDVSPRRIHRLRTRLAQSGLSNVQPEVLAHESDARLKRLAGKIDRVLVDAPCTGFGTLRRNPDLKWRQTEGDLAALQDKQSRILEAAVRLLKPGGRLVYATCSVLPQENEGIIARFVEHHPELIELDCEQILAKQGIVVPCGARLRLLPHQHATDGFFAAAFERPRQ